MYRQPPRHADRNAAHQNRHGPAGPKGTRGRDRAPARSRPSRFARSLDHGHAAAGAHSPPPASYISDAGLSPASRRILERVSQGRHPPVRRSLKREQGVLRLGEVKTPRSRRAIAMPRPVVDASRGTAATKRRTAGCGPGLAGRRPRPSRARSALYGPEQPSPRAGSGDQEGGPRPLAPARASTQCRVSPVSGWRAARGDRGCHGP